MTPMTPIWKQDAESVAGTPFEPGRRRDVVVVGAGLTGLSTALLLTRQGMDVAVVEADEVGGLASGANTGKLTLLQGSVLSALRRHHPANLVRAYVESNIDGAHWLTSIADELRVSYSHRTAYSYAQTPAGVAVIEAELHAATEAGLPVRRVEPDLLAQSPFDMVDAVALDRQVAIDPQRLLVALTHALLREGGTLHTGVRVTRVHAVPRAGVETEAGFVAADHVVLATATPITDRGLYFAKVRGLRSSGVAFATEGPLLEGLYLAVDGETKSVRSITADDGPAHAAQLVVGGNGFPVGRSPSPLAAVNGLVAWTQHHFPGAEPVASWSAQDYESHDLIPFVGAMPRGLGRIRFATGYAKWGLSNAPAAALRLTAEITRVPRRERPDWMNVIATRFTVPADLARGGVQNLRIGWEAASGWIGAQAVPTPVRRPAEGDGVVASRGGQPVGISTVEGRTCAVSAVCTHLGGVLRWNDAELTWDCPLHASRFTADGHRVEGPALRNLARLPRVPGEELDDDPGASLRSEPDIDR
ncbi:glycine/D-amino acid oxidase-like deaminating enzyme/nitrite reductase/ring-hydroxylating ferredoxin subunit [Microbacterium trichothecenolyticum]|uniref:FAD-dependent oxidoreductase n=2 Tax=Microbacterium TaxID=33882 RepID=UPI0028567AF1|nr:FAD-dependent oxidoreductase [Microbacterium trichothecenolyticum]MDR7185131.1 glycine/D-amino acid oxidase-like deaminating enzyme/nitrite reductase/ring-hydroxylating ferredoxin subunit [Microbacterium trichothecenolyticum]